MKGKYSCLAAFFLLQKKEGDYSMLIEVAKMAGIACRVAASSNKSFHLTFSATLQNAGELNRSKYKYENANCRMSKMCCQKSD
jgi:hypothetical protein